MKSKQPTSKREFRDGGFVGRTRDDEDVTATTLDPPAREFGEALRGPVLPDVCAAFQAQAAPPFAPVSVVCQLP